jgi:hypothetical protein
MTATAIAAEAIGSARMRSKVAIMARSCGKSWRFLRQLKPSYKRRIGITGATAQ